MRSTVDGNKQSGKVELIYSVFGAERPMQMALCEDSVGTTDPPTAFTYIAACFSRSIEKVTRRGQSSGIGW